MNETPKYVVSGTLQRADWNNSTIIDGYSAETISALKDQVDGGIYVSGSRTLVRALLADGLVDELNLFVYPVVLGTRREAVRRQAGEIQPGADAQLRERGPTSRIPAGVTARAQLGTHDRRAGAQRLELGERPGAREVLHPAVGGGHESFGGHVGERSADPVGHVLGGLNELVAEVEHAEDDDLRAQLGQLAEVEARLRSSIEICWAGLSLSSPRKS